MHSMNHKMAIFDLFGTMVRFGAIHHHPYRKILQWAQQNGRRPHPDDARTLMTTNGNVDAIFSTLGINPPSELLNCLHREVQEEIDSLELFEDVLPTLKKLTSAGISIAICSNLAQPYGAAIDKLLPQFNFLRCLSYEVGFIKPEKDIYHWLIVNSGFRADECFFVGDTFTADYEGPTAVGMQARHLIRGASPKNHTIGNLFEVLQYS